MNIETMYNTPALGRFHFPGTLVWGVDSRWRVPEILEAGDVGLFVDVAFEHDDFVEHLRRTLGSRLAFVEVCSSMPRTQHLHSFATKTAAPAAIVSVGGGSTVDAAKAVMAHWIYGTFDGVGMGAKRGLPIQSGARRPLLVGVPTTAGTGADASRYYVTYDADTGGKVHGKSWRLVADWIVLDPVFLRRAPVDLLAKSAFDTFVHAFETFVCRQEQSWFGDMLALDTMARLLPALDRVVSQNARDDHALLELLYASAVAGIGISNIRTGNIHEAAGALLERCSLSHPETLMVFFRAAYSQYCEAIASREALLMRRLCADAPALGLRSFDDVIGWWERAFAATGLSERIAGALAAIANPQELRSHVFTRVRDDRVWCTKESPVPLDDGMIRAFIDEALTAHGV